MKLLVDMNLSPRGVSVLADAGVEATHWSMLRVDKRSGLRNHGLRQVE